MPQKSIEQYERELMEMYRLALAKDPNYAALAQRHSAAAVDENIPEEEIVVTIPAPGVEEAVPLPRGIVPALPEEVATPTPSAQTQPAEVTAPQVTLPSGPVGPSAVAVVLPVEERISRPDSGLRARTQTPARAETDVEIDLLSDANPEVGVNPDAILDVTPDAETIPDTTVEVEADTGTESDLGAQAPTPTGPSQAAAPPAAAEAQPIEATPNIGAGNLIVNVTTQNRTRPVTNAVVTVSHPDESGNKVAARVVTDNSGKTELIRLPAPIREIPVYPQPMTGGDLSARYIVDVQAPGFESVSGEEISIFDGVTSVKRIDLTAETDAGRAANSATAESRSDAQGE